MNVIIHKFVKYNLIEYQCILLIFKYQFIPPGLELVRIVLGNNLLAGEMPQAMIPAGTWFAAKIKDEKGYPLVSCTVAPGFDFADFELAKREELISEFPHIAGVIEEFTPATGTGISNSSLSFYN